MSKAHEQTDLLIEKLERRIRRLYAKETKNLREKVTAYFRQFDEKDKELRAKLKAGEIAEKDFVNWRLQHIARSKEFLSLRDEVAEKITDTAEKAAEMTADALPEMCIINYNEERDGVDGITPLTVAAAVALLSIPKLKRKKELAFNKRNFSARVTGMILIDHTPEIRGKPALVTTLDFTVKRSRESMVYNARTVATYAENRARQAVYDDMAKLGMQVTKQWFTQGDSRVRHSHAEMHGEKVPEDQPFIVDGYELMFPGDGRNAPPRVYYNCRCYMRRERKKA